MNAIRKFFQDFFCSHDWEFQVHDEASKTMTYVCRKCGVTRSFPCAL